MLSVLANDTRRVQNSVMGTAAECTNCHVPPSIELNLTNAEFIRGGESTANSPCPVCLFTLLDASIDRHFALFNSIPCSLPVFRKRLYSEYLYPECISNVVQFVVQ